ncbi:MAG: TlpA family protein disulfide reductase [Oscillospiraceae bacterium]|nr:TlpA family protein disulfide reductase [Oscillospiraceae bacterium]
MTRTGKIIILFVLLIGVLTAGVLAYKGLDLMQRQEKEDTEESAGRKKKTEDREDAKDGEEPAAESGESPSEPEAVKISPDATADFTVLDVNGNAVKLSDAFGKPIVVNFWATWCGPCRSELGHFDELCAEYGDDVVFMMVNLTDGTTDTVESVKAFAAEYGYSFPLYFDTEYSGVYAYSVNAIPVTLFINADGTLHHQQIGSMDEDTIRGFIEEIVQ